MNLGGVVGGINQWLVTPCSQWALEQKVEAVALVYSIMEALLLE